MKRRFDTRCTPSRFHSEEHITFIVLKPCSASAEVVNRNCFHGALQFNKLFRHTRSTMVDEMPFCAVLKSMLYTTSSGTAATLSETRRAMQLTPECDLIQQQLIARVSIAPWTAQHERLQWAPFVGGSLKPAVAWPYRLVHFRGPWLSCPLAMIDMLACVIDVAITVLYCTTNNTEK